MGKNNDQENEDKEKGNLHNNMFRACFSDPAAAGLLFSEHLPPELMEIFSPGPPELAPGSGLSEVEILTVLRYILWRHNEITGDDLNRVLLEYEPERKDRIMHPLFQEHFDKGKTEGKAEGKAEGLAEGEARGRAEMLLKLLSRRFGRPSADVEQRVRAASAETLDRWSLRVLDAASLSDVFDN